MFVVISFNVTKAFTAKMQLQLLNEVKNSHLSATQDGCQSLYKVSSVNKKTWVHLKLKNFKRKEVMAILCLFIQSNDFFFFFLLTRRWPAVIWQQWPLHKAS